ncbi:hypothetical protein [Rufibacter ruber]|uniref:hypothetical protein n=1 Tax=Rufibacter ruber TaxID=1783499 RepID=UPI000ADF6219|nr:hypothetical protein [Rufibacter ruber]
MLPSYYFMMKKNFTLSCCALAVWVSSCQEQPAPTAAQSKQQAFGLEAYLNQEAQNLHQATAAVTKTVSENGKAQETKTFSQLNWAEELGPFAEADINKPALLGAFTEEKTTNAAGQTVHRYRAKEEADATVRDVAYTFDAQGQLVQVDATLVQENMLFNTQKKLHLELQPAASPRLQSYSLDETQKLMFMGPQRYSVAGKVQQK